MNTQITFARFGHWAVTGGLLAIACLMSSTAQAQRPSIAAQQAQIATLQTQVATLQTQVIPNAAGYVTMDISTPSRPVLRVAGANLQVVNGLGATASVNGLGNVIVGYDEASGAAGLTAVCSLGQYTTQPACTGGGGTWQVEHKEGSHNLVVGPSHRYSGYGGLVAGGANTVNSDAASVTGGAYNTASGSSASVSGGLFNTASGYYASVSDGYFNTASGDYASVSGGHGCNSGPTTFLWIVGTLTGGCSLTLHN